MTCVCGYGLPTPCRYHIGFLALGLYTVSIISICDPGDVDIVYKQALRLPGQCCPKAVGNSKKKKNLGTFNARSYGSKGDLREVYCHVCTRKLETSGKSLLHFQCISKT